MTEGWAGTAAPELSRRIEALAAQAAAEARTEQELLRAVEQVRGDLGSLRGELESVRGEVTSARGDLEGVRGELASVRGDLAGVSNAVEEAAPPMEARLAALEDTLDGVAERLEAFARDGAATTSERLSVLARDVAALSTALTSRTDELREFVADRTADSAATLLDAAAHGDDEVVTRLGESIAGLAGSVRDAIDAFAGSVERSLTALGTSVGSALADARDTHDDHLDEVATAIEERVDRLVTDQQQASSAMVGELRGIAAELGTRLEAQGDVADAMREDVTTLVGELRTELTELVGGVRGQIQEELEALRADLLGAIADGTASTKSLLVENDRTAAGRIAEIKRGIDVHAHELDGTTKQVASLAKAANETKAVLVKMEEGWGDVARTVVEEAHAAAAAELDEFRGRMRTELEGLRNALRETTDTVLDARGQLNEGTTRLGTAGEALLQYLAERDNELEEARDRILHELLDDFAEGLKPKERRRVADLLQTSRERAAQKRDAERWRKQRSGEAPPAPVPLVVGQPAAERVPEPVQPEPVEPVAEPVVEPIPEPVVETPAPEPEPERAPEPVAEAPDVESDPAAAFAAVVTEAGAPVVKEVAKPAKPAKVTKSAAAKPAAKAVAKKPAAKAAKPAAKKAPAKAVKAAKPAKPAKAPAAAPAEPVAAETPAPEATAEPAKPARKPAARRQRASVDSMPEVSSPSAAIDATVEPAPEPPVPEAEEHDPGAAAIDAFAAALKPARRGIRRR